MIAGPAIGNTVDGACGISATDGDRVGGELGGVELADGVEELVGVSGAVGAECRVPKGVAW